MSHDGEVGHAQQRYGDVGHHSRNGKAEYLLVYISHRGLEIQLDINAHVEWVGLLGEDKLSAGCTAFHDEGAGAGIGDVAPPQTYNDIAAQCVAMGAKCSVEWLAQGVGLVPIDAALGGHIGTDNQGMYTWVARVDAVVYR